MDDAPRFPAIDLLLIRGDLLLCSSCRRGTTVHDYEPGEASEIYRNRWGQEIQKMHRCDGCGWGWNPKTGETAAPPGLPVPLSREAAIERVETALGEACGVLHEHIVEHPWGYLLPYQSRRYLESGNAEDALIGPGPIAVRKHDGVMIRLPQHPVHRNAWLAVLEGGSHAPPPEP